MPQHSHPKPVPGCFRCELTSDELGISEMTWPDPENPELVLGLAKVLSGAAPEFQGSEALNHLSQADRLVHSEWFSSLITSIRQQGLIDGWDDAVRAVANVDPVAVRNPYRS